MTSPREAPAPAAGDAPTPAPAGEARPARVGVLGGAFNPPHRGHLALALHARDELGLERVLLMPARISPGKPACEDPGPGRRLEMCRLAVDRVDGLRACALELERDGPSYTVDTLRTLHAAHPHTPLTLIVGADVARTMPTWREPRELLALADLAVALRAGVGPEEVRDALAPLPVCERGPCGALRFLSMPTIDVSSSLVRDRVRRGLPVDELLEPAVAAYIAANGLYREAHAEAVAR